ncbi:MAG: T9SS type A sorting domain-containing protein [Sphingobacteriales bacterium]|nr:MAG: T9SS type A sorting domain-containing protein [Sphingobacteriales bacterium]
MRNFIVALTICLFVGVIPKIAAQTPYSNYIDYTSEWTILNISLDTDFNGTYCGSFGTIYHKSYLTYYITGDTVVNSMAYYKMEYNLIDSIFCVNGANIPFVTTNTSIHPSKPIREDSLKRFYYLNTNGTEVNFVDFNYNIGSTVTTCTISDIDTIYFNETPLKKYCCSCFQPDSFNAFIIEGIGYGRGFFDFWGCSMGIESSFTSVSYRKQGIELDFNSVTTCSLLPTDIAPSKVKENTLYVYPNPGFGTYQIHSDYPITCAKVYNTFGQIIYETETAQIDIHFVPAGMYFVYINTQAGPVLQKIIKW